VSNIGGVLTALMLLGSAVIGTVLLLDETPYRWLDLVWLPVLAALFVRAAAICGWIGRIW
jgi:hypothetical protein